MEQLKDKVVVCLLHEVIWREERCGSIHSYFGTRWRWVVSFASRPPYPQGENLRCQLNNRLDSGPTGGLHFPKYYVSPKDRCRAYSGAVRNCDPEPPVFGSTTCPFVGWDSSVDIATRYGLDGPGIESRWGGEILRNRPDRPWCPPRLLCNGYRVFFPGCNAAGAWRWPPTPI